MARFEPVPDRQKPRLSGAFLERMMGLEPTTFGMATRPRLQPSAASFRLMPLCSRIAQRPGCRQAAAGDGAAGKPNACKALAAYRQSATA